MTEEIRQYIAIPIDDIREVQAALADESLEFLKAADGNCWFRQRWPKIKAVPPAVPAAVEGDTSECVFEPLDSCEGLSDVEEEDVDDDVVD